MEPACALCSIGSVYVRALRAPRSPGSPAQQKPATAAAETAASAAAIRGEAAELLLRLAKRLPAKGPDRVVFLVNNYDQVLSIFAERGVPPGVGLARLPLLLRVVLGVLTYRARRARRRANGARSHRHRGRGRHSFHACWGR